MVIPKTFSIVHLEMLNVLVADRLFKGSWEKKLIHVRCDNLAVVQVLTSGATRDPYLAAIARNIWLVTALNYCKLKVTHIAGKQNIVADMLSRWSGTHNDIYMLQSKVPGCVWCEVKPEMLYIDTDI